MATTLGCSSSLAGKSRKGGTAAGHTELHPAAACAGDPLDPVDLTEITGGNFLE